MPPHVKKGAVVLHASLPTLAELRAWLGSGGGGEDPWGDGEAGVREEEGEEERAIRALHALRSRLDSQVRGA